MRLVIDLDGSEREVEVARFTGTATVSDLVAALTGQRPREDERLYLDERPVDLQDKLADLDLLDGARLGVAPLALEQPLRGWTVAQAGGLQAGLVKAPPANRPMVVGRSPQADVVIDSSSVSWDHATVVPDPEGLRVVDRGSTNGTFVSTRGHQAEKVEGDDGLLVEDEAAVTVGGSTLLLRDSLKESLAPRAGSLHNVTPAGTAPFNRPPRPGQPPRPEPIAVPEERSITDATKFNIVMVAAPLLMAVGMITMTKDLRFAAFALLSPLMAVGSWYEQKSRKKRERKDEAKRFEEALASFQRDIAAAADTEAVRRRSELPDPATTLRIAALPTTQLWQRRFGAHDFLALHAGMGQVPWVPPTERPANGKLHERVKPLLDAAVIPSSPVEVALGDAGVVGIVGDREGALALARSLICQAAVHSGPADVTIGVFCDGGREDDWQWTTWLPHTRWLGGTGGQRWFSHNRQRSNEMLRQLRDSLTSLPTPALLLVIDSDVLTEGRESPARSLLGSGRHMNQSASTRERVHEVSGIVIAATEDQLPAACTTVVTVGDDAAATVTRPDDLKHVDDVVLGGISLERARRCALDLARFEDPELATPGAALPSLVRLPPLLDLESPTAEMILESWRTSTGVATPVGVGENGSYELDIVRDGPHGLVGGTTGSGKSEFLRSLVAGLAARNAPTKLTFILIDFKGGAAFASCERLPHTIGTVSNLDEQLADRALRALEAEMEYRQRLFAAAGEGVDNLDAFMRTKPAEPLPRLLLVVDEFAMLAKDYPDVLSSLVRVAAVGRTLGVHMILATQRPAGVVNDDILANTNLRVALRVQSKDDSNNVIGVPDAAAIANVQKGRAYVKLGQDDITPVQTALVTGPAQDESEIAPVELLDLRDGVPVPAPPKPKRKDALSELDLLIDAIVAANDEAGYAAPRPVWPEPLDARVDLAGFESTLTDGAAVLPVVGGLVGDVCQVGVADDPDHQRQVPAGWDLSAGNLLLLGIPGYGTTTALASIALNLAAHTSPEELDLWVLDMGARDLAVLEGLPHISAYVSTGAGGRERQMRFLRLLRTELERRRSAREPQRRCVVLIDGLAALKDEYQDYEGQALLEGLYRVYADGPDLGMHFAVATSRARAIPSAIDEVTTQKWLFRLADRYDYSVGGLKPHEAPSPVPGRCVPSTTHLQTHIATPAMPWSDAVAKIASQWVGIEKEQVVRQLPSRASVADLGVVAETTGEPWQVPVGIREADLEPQMVELYENEHMLVAGPARSGKSTLLLAIAEALRGGAQATGLTMPVWGICGRRSPLGRAGLDRVVVGPDEIPALVAAARLHQGPLVLLIDDAEQFDDADQSLEGLLAANLPGLHIIAAGRADDLRSLYSHWTKTVRKSRAGVLLQPNKDYDGDLLGVQLPRTTPVEMSVARGYACVSGRIALVQAVTSDPS